MSYPGSGLDPSSIARQPLLPLNRRGRLRMFAAKARDTNLSDRSLRGGVSNFFTLRSLLNSRAIVLTRQT